MLNPNGAVAKAAHLNPQLLDAKISPAIVAAYREQRQAELRQR